MNSTPISVVYIIVISEAILAFIGVLALSLTMFFKTYSDPAVLTSLIAITSGLIGSLGTILANPRQPVEGATTTTTTTTTPPTPSEPTPVTIQQPKTDPVPVVNQPQPPP
jgi:hypothetical protein